MIPFLSFIFTAALLTLEGRMLFALVMEGDCPRRDCPPAGRALGWSLGYPIGALLNALLFFVLQLTGIPFTPMSVIGGHVFIIVLLGSVCRGAPRGRPEQAMRKGSSVEKMPSAGRPRGAPLRPSERCLCVVLILFLILVFLSSALYALTLPTIYWDSFAHWAMRSRQALQTGFFGVEGVVQPQFPILLHALQMVHNVMLGWGDTRANAGTFLLSLSAYAAVFLLVRRRADFSCALLTLTLLTGIPLVIVHLRQGMADVHVTAFVLLSALLLDCALLENDRRSLILSALFVSAAAWTKYEGLYFGLVPWFLIVVAQELRSRSYGWVPWLQRKPLHRPTPIPVLPLTLALALTLPWPLYTLARGLPISPHGASFSIHLDALPRILEQLFAFGTFGLHWWAIALLLILLFREEWRRLPSFLLRHPSLLWGIIVLAMLLLIYLFTDEVLGLVRRDNFSRAMLLPTLLLTQALALTCRERHGASGTMPECEEPFNG